MPRSAAWYSAPISEFLATSEDEVLGCLFVAGSFDVTQSQRGAWREEVLILRQSLVGVEGWLALEFDIPRLGSRVDAVVIGGPAIFPIEFKVGQRDFLRGDRNQAWDYALDLKNFHAASHRAPIFPVLVATEALAEDSNWGPPHADQVRPPRHCGRHGLATAISDALRTCEGPSVGGAEWMVAPYQPTPTIIEAAQALYARHTVEAISRHDAGAKNLTRTSLQVESVIESAARERFKAIIFVTGVPGAGKTLVGLNVATQRRRTEDATHAVFLSGNGPLVDVLREALTRDELLRRRVMEPGTRKGSVAQQVKPFVQNVHHFRDEGVRTMGSAEPPHDHVVIFDEAQRAWDLEKTADFMRRRKDRPGFDRSEPQFLVEYMNRHQDWAVVVCLVGGGQEINTGEAGISTWLDAIRVHFPNWRVYISPELSDSEYAAGHALERLQGLAHVERRQELHLSVSMRAFRSERVSAFVKALLDVDVPRAQELHGQIAERYPIAVTRDLGAAKQWTRSRARGSERYGLVASSGGQRLKPYAVDVRVEINPVHWFLNDADDTRSSFYLEDAATEYQIQGLELDWICVTWDADLRFNGQAWEHRSFNAKGWQNINKTERRQYLVNAYRVLLTRARQGMVIFVPAGDSTDPTRPPEFYDLTYNYLRELGIPPLGGEVL